MKTEQKPIIYTALFVMAAMGIYPPWVHIASWQERRYAYGWVFDPPQGPTRRAQTALDAAMEYPNIYPVRFLDLVSSIENEIGCEEERKLPAEIRRIAPEYCSLDPSELVQQFISKNIEEYPNMSRIRIVKREPARDRDGNFVLHYFDPWSTHLVPDTFPQIELDGFTLPDGTRNSPQMEPEPGWRTQIDRTRLLVQWLIAGFVIGGVMLGNASERQS